MTDLKNRLDTLCVFRDLREDAVIVSLCDFLQAPTNAAYAALVAHLYRANGGDLAAYVRQLCENSTNVYVQTVGRGEAAPSYMREALIAELQVLQEVAALTADDLRGLLNYDGFLPAFFGEKRDLVAHYLSRVDHIGRHGYGIYAQNRMFFVDADGHICPVRHPDPIRLSHLVDYERERQALLDNTRALLAGRPAANALLTGDAGTGKSSTVKAVVNELWQEGLRIVEVRKEQLQAIPAVLDELSGNPLKFVLFIDDISFLEDDDCFNALKAVLEGSVTAKSRNVVIYATSNRRHIVRETFSGREGDEIHRNDTMQEMISLSERFGLHITFSKPDKETFLHIVHHLAAEQGIDTPTEQLDLLAERFALERGGRSARLAGHFVDSLLAAKADFDKKGIDSRE